MRTRIENLKRFIANEITPIGKAAYLKDDIIAAISVTFVAIPLSLAVAVASGVAPQVGLISAIFGGIIGALFGGCRLSVTGPAVAMSVLVANTVQNYGFTGLLVVGTICGLLQIIFGVLKLGRLAKIIPLSLVLAFTAGIGVILFFGQIAILFNLNAAVEHPVMGLIHHWGEIVPKVTTAGIWLTLLTLAILGIVPRFLPRAYAFAFAVFIPMAIAYFGNFPVRLIGEIPHDLVHPDIIDFSQIGNWKSLIITGIEVFILASLETLLSTSAVDIMGKGDLHNPNQELIGQGIANVGVAVFGGIPVTSVIARSSVNVLAGAKTRRAALLHALIIFVIVYFGSEFIEKVPMAVLTGILMAAAFKMMNFRQVVDLWKNDRLEVLVYAITFIAIVVTDLISGIQAGLFAAFILVAFRMMRTKADIKLWTNKNVLRVGLNGNVSILAYDELNRIKELALAQAGLKFVIFEFAALHKIDTSGAKHLVTIAKELADENIKTIFHGMTTDHQAVILQVSSSEANHYQITVMESQIKEILEKSGIEHSANDVLKHGIVKFTSNYAKDNQELISTLAKGQKPHTLLITCSDSRLNPNAFFSANIGEIFIVRNVGNVVPPYMPNNIYSEIAAIEYAVYELGVRNIVICGHTECGAVKASYATGDKDLGYIGLDNWLSIIKDGFRKHKPTDAAHGVKVNLLNQVDNLKTYPKIVDMIANTQITVNAWIYDVHSGNMLEWDERKRDFEVIA